MSDSHVTYVGSVTWPWTWVLMNWWGAFFILYHSLSSPLKPKIHLLLPHWFLFQYIILLFIFIFILISFLESNFAFEILIKNKEVCIYHHSTMLMLIVDYLSYIYECEYQSWDLKFFGYIFDKYFNLDSEYNYSQILWHWLNRLPATISQNALIWVDSS